MNRPHFNDFVDAAFKRSRQVLVKKGYEYSTSDEVFHNFNEATFLSLHETNVAVGWEFMVKHLQSIKDMITSLERGGALNITDELLNEKFGDAINYLLLIEGMIRERMLPSTLTSSLTPPPQEPNSVT